MGFLMTFLKRPLRKSPSSSRQNSEINLVCLTRGSPSQGQEEPDHQRSHGGANEPSENNNVSSSVTPTTLHHAITSSSITTNHGGPVWPLVNHRVQSDSERPSSSSPLNSAAVGPPMKKNASVGGPPMSSGPFGGVGGNPFDDGTYNTVKQVIITWELGIYSFHVEYDKDGETSVWFSHGTATGENSYTVKLNYPDECLISVAGYKGEYLKGSFTFVRSLTFQSNQRTYGPFGIEEGAYFSFALTGSKIIGFHGRSGSYLDSIGAYFLHSPYSERPSSPLDSAAARPPMKKNASVGGPPVSFGPFGGPGGSPFDDGTYSTVKQIIITWDLGIYSIHVEYVKDGESSVWTRHGTATGNNSYTVKVNYPDECLISVAGYRGGITKGSFTFVRSLTFQSNQRTYGPFGVEEGTYFSFGLTGSKIIGFHGRCGLYLDSIGAYFPPLSL